MPGQSENTAAMPLGEFLDEVMQLLENDPDGKEIQVERVKFLRYGEARGDQDKVIAALNTSDPHGK
jgi:short-subunit dehydrogenase involved in D-alanine esterification of teichoic acids